jgi:hypothetical protein
MMKKAFFAFFTVLLTLTLGAALSAQTTATLKDVKGKVEVKPFGKNWVPAQEGMKIDLLATISTGFDSSASLAIAENKIAVAPLTRLTVDKIVEQAGTLGTSLHLRVGKVSAQVKSSAGVSQDFKVTSPYSTASVRGTEFEYDGLFLGTIDGTVMFLPGKPVRDIVVPASDRRTQGDDGADAEESGDAPAAADGAAGAGGDAAGTDADTEGDAEGDAAGGGDAPETMGTEELESFKDALQEAFPEDTFELVDNSGETFQPSGPADQGGAPSQDRPAPGPAPQAIEVAKGNAAILALDFSAPVLGAAGAPGNRIRTGSRDSVTPNSGGSLIPASGSGPGGEEEMKPLAPPPPPAPTTGRIKININ